MLKSFSSKAIASKARSMYGHRLTVNDYTEMMKKGTVGEVAIYLRDNTRYANALSNLTMENTHRGQLEERLRSLRYDQYATLSRYAFSQKAGFYQYVFLWDEIEQLIKLLRYIGGGSEGDFFPQYSKYLPKYCSYNISVLSLCKDYPSLLEQMKGTAYEAIIKRYPPHDDREKNQIDMVLCECELRNYYYRRVFAMIDKEFFGGARKELKSIFMEEIDAENLADAYRLRRFFRSDSEYIRKALLPYETSSKKLIDKIINCTDDNALPEILSGSRFIKNGRIDSDYIENITQRERDRVSRHTMRYATHPSSTLVGYMNQTEIELENIVNIIEGIRYGLEPPDIKKLLILPA